MIRKEMSIVGFAIFYHPYVSVLNAESIQSNTFSITH